MKEYLKVKCKECRNQNICKYCSEGLFGIIERANESLSTQVFGEDFPLTFECYCRNYQYKPSVEREEGEIRRSNIDLGF